MSANIHRRLAVAPLFHAAEAIRHHLPSARIVFGGGCLTVSDGASARVTPIGEGWHVAAVSEPNTWAPCYSTRAVVEAVRAILTH